MLVHMVATVVADDGGDAPGCDGGSGRRRGCYGARQLAVGVEDKGGGEVELQVGFGEREESGGATGPRFSVGT